MMSPQYVEVEARTVEEALESALEQLGAEREEVTIKVLSEGSKGILGLGAKPAHLRVTLREAPQDTPEQILENILRYMGHRATIRSQMIDGSLHLHIQSENAGLLIGRHGQTLDSLQYVLNCVINKSSLVKRRIILDVEGYREKRRVMLEELALRLASKAKQVGQDVVLDPMPPQDRRIVHVTLQDDSDVRTFSRGDGALRSVVITLRDGYQPSHNSEYRQDDNASE